MILMMARTDTPFRPRQQAQVPCPYIGELSWAYNQFQTLLARDLHWQDSKKEKCCNAKAWAHVSVHWSAVLSATQNGHSATQTGQVAVGIEPSRTTHGNSLLITRSYRSTENNAIWILISLKCEPIAFSFSDCSNKTYQNFVKQDIPEYLAAKLWSTRIFAAESRIGHCIGVEFVLNIVEHRIGHRPQKTKIENNFGLGQLFKIELWMVAQ